MYVLRKVARKTFCDLDRAVGAMGFDVKKFEHLGGEV